MKKTIYFNNKKIILSPLERCLGLKRTIGLMFKRKEKAKALLFEFKKPVKISISSFFCPPFLIIWLDKKNRVLDFKMINSQRIIYPRKKYFSFVEIPQNQKYKGILCFFLGKEKDLNTSTNNKD